MTTSISGLDSESTYARHRQQALALINQLRSIGAQADLDLPRIVVIGNQSAGKSSLVEAISGINVPRDAGTCTRCPIECRLSQTGPEQPWGCRVSIRWEFEQDGRRQDEVQELVFGPALTRQQDVELTLRRAQARVLNPSMPLEAFLNMDLDELKKPRPSQLKFSRNAVCVDISGPQLVDLAFVDLPGIVQNADEEIVTMVEELVKFHISGNCLILVALPMSDDIENQKAMRLAENADPSGERRIGVLTKPDLVKTATQKAHWMSVIEGHAHVLKHGYYCTRQPDDDERANGITAEDARASEAAFFAKTVPWARHAHTGRFGTQNLVTSLSLLLARMINEKLPTLSKETETHLAECESRLAALPPPITSEPTTFVLGLVNQFCAEYKSYVEGHTLAVTLVQDTRRTYRKFQKDIRATAPRFIPFDDKSRTGEYAKELFMLEEEEELVDTFALQTSVVTLSQVRECIAKAVTRELPGNIPYSAKVTFILDFQRTWNAHVQACASAVLLAVQGTISRLVKSVFGPYTNMEPKLTHAVNELVQAKFKELEAQLAKFLGYEKITFTQNDHYLFSSKEKFLATYTTIRSKVLDAPGQQPVFFPAPGQPIPFKQAEKKAVSTSPTPSASASSHGNFWSPPRSRHYDSPSTVSFGFTGHIFRDLGRVVTIQSITTIPEFENWSFEELRLTDTAPPFSFNASNSSGTAQTSATQQQFAFNPPATNAAVPAQSTVIPRQNVVPPVQNVAAPAPVQNAVVFTQDTRAQDEATALGALARLGFKNVTVADLNKLNTTDEYKEELELMADVRAYFKVAYKRMIDYIPLAIDYDFMFALAGVLQEWLIQKLGLGSKSAAERCAMYLAEEPHIVAAREELQARKKRLEKVQEELLNFGL